MGVLLLVIAIAATIGISTPLWSMVGLARLLARRRVPRHRASLRFTVDDVAILIAAHNEELVIEHTVRAAAARVPAGHVFVVSDGSHDATARLAEAAGATVLELHPNRGKAGAIVAGLEQLRLAERFGVVLLLDADTVLETDYFVTGLPFFDAPDVVAVAGCAVSEPSASDRAIPRLLGGYRQRVYTVMQYLQKFGQAFPRANAVAIVPGFASMYRSDSLRHMDIDAPGLSIEDYNMTFEVHTKKLGRIAFDPRCARARTQDPETIGEYTKQVRRWNLGFWQTVLRHGPHLGTFWVSLAIAVVELLVSSVVLVLMIPAMVVSTGAWLLVDVPGSVGEAATQIVSIAPAWAIALAFIVQDLALSAIAAVIQRRFPSPLSLLVFPVLRIADGVLCLRSLFDAVRRSGSDGRWMSPSRRPLIRESDDPVRLR